MLRRLANIARIRENENGSMAIETAFVIPILLILALGGFEVSSIVARQTELQSAAAEAAAVVRATIPETAEQRTTVRDILVTSTGLTEEQVTITEIYRCGTADDYVANSGTCGGATQYTFIQVDITDTYNPVWTQFGISDGFTYNISRTVQIG